MTISCLTCKERIARARGVCRACREKHRKAVLAGLTTYEELQRQGSILPACRPPRHPWFNQLWNKRRRLRQQ